MKNRIPLLSALPVLLLMTACGQQTAETHAVTLERTDSPAALADLVDRIELTPLETGENIVAGAEGLETAGTDILLVQGRPSEPAILRFDADGHFLGRIGRYGKGPDEYQQIRNIQVTGNEVTVFTVSDDILTYDLEGRCLQKQHQDGTGMQSWRVPEGILSYKGFGSGTPARVVLHAPDGDRNFLETDAKVLNLGSNNPLFCQSGGATFFSDTYNPTIYCYENGRIQPVVSFDLGEVALPEKFFQFDDSFAAAEYMMSAPEGFGLVTLYRKSEAYQLVLATIQKETDTDLCYGICPEGGAWRWFSLGKPGESAWAGSLRTLDGKCLYAILDPGLLDGPDHGTGGEFEALREKIVNPEVLDGIQPDDNPVIAVIHLK